ncbi:MAG TPA: hypothetical protein VG034_06460 [Acidimicrobiia bacterium]|nr:hypothetical protein [Acidimicrobiia bacterium]
MPVRTDRCPHCLAALSSDVGPACPHCRRSLLPSGRKARKAAEQEWLARAQRAQNAAPQPAHPHQPHPPAFLMDPESPVFVMDPPPGPAAAAPPAWAAPTPLPPVPPPPSAWGASTPMPPMPPGPQRPAWRRRGVTALLVVAAIVGSVGGRFAVEAVVNGIGTKVSETDKLANVGEPTPYDGPTFSVRLPGSVKVQQVEENGLTTTVYGSEVGNIFVGVSVLELGPDGAYDFAAGAKGILGKVGGRIASDIAIDVAGRPAHDLVFTGVRGKATSWTRLIVDKTRVYQIAAVALGEHTEPPADYAVALDSFVMR